MRELVQEIWPPNSGFTRTEQWTGKKVALASQNSADPHDRGTHIVQQNPLRDLSVHPGLRTRSERVSHSNFTDSCTASQDTRMQRRNEVLRKMSLLLESPQQFCARVLALHASCFRAWDDFQWGQLEVRMQSWPSEEQKSPQEDTQNHDCRNVDLVCVSRAETYTRESNT